MLPFVFFVEDFSDSFHVGRKRTMVTISLMLLILFLSAIGIDIGRTAEAKDAVEIGEYIGFNNFLESWDDDVGVTMGTDVVSADESMNCSQIHVVMKKARETHVGAFLRDRCLFFPIWVLSL